MCGWFVMRGRVTTVSVKQPNQEVRAARCSGVSRCAVANAIQLDYVRILVLHQVSAGGCLIAAYAGVFVC